MKHNKIIIFVIVLLVSVSLASATTNDAIGAWTFDDADITGGDDQIDKSGYSVRLNMTGAPTTGVTGKVGEAYDFDGTNDYAAAGNESHYDITGDMHIAAWVYSDVSLASGQWEIVTKYTGAAQNYVLQVYNGQLWFNFKGGSVAVKAITGSAWQFVEGVKNSSGVYSCVNLACGRANDDGVHALNNALLQIGTRDLGSVKWNGKIDMVLLYNRSLTPAERAQLYNGGSGYNPYPNYLQITAAEFDAGTAINTFNATVSNSTVSWNFNTTSGLMDTNLTTGQYNITVIAQNYFNNVTLNHDVANQLNAKMAQTNITFSSVHEVTGASITGVTYSSSNGQQSASFLYLPAGSPTVTASKPGYYNNARTITITALEDSSRQINLTDYIINVTAYNYTGGQISTFDVTATYLNGSYSKTYSTTNGYIGVLALNGTWNITLDAGGYAIFSNVTTATTNYTTVNFTDVFTTNSVNISFYDQDTLTILNDITITADLISGVYANNYTTTDGYLYLDLLSPATYQILYSGSGGYDSRTAYFTLTNRSYNALSLYLMNGSTTVTVTLYDQFNNLIEGYKIQLLRYYVSSNSYIVVDEGITNFEGITKLDAELNDPFYKFRIYDTDLTLIKTTGSTQLYDTSINLFIELGERVGELLDKLENVTYNLDFLTSSNQFRLIFTNRAGTSVDAKIDVYISTPTGETLNTTSSVSASSGTLYATVTPVNGTTYKAYGYIKFPGDTDYKLVDVMTYTYSGIVDTFGMYGLFLSLIIVVAFIMIGVSNPTISTILVPISLILTRIAGLHSLEWSIITGITAISIIIIYLISDRA